MVVHVSRRSFVAVSVGAMIAHSASTAVAQDATPTPINYPSLPKGIAPRPITDEVDLLYFQVFKGSDGPLLAGEIRNNTDYWVYAPALILTFALDDGSTVQVQPWVKRPNIAPKSRGQFVGLQTTEITAKQLSQLRKTATDEVTITTCDVGEDAPDESYAGLVVTSHKGKLNLDRGSFAATVKVENQGDTPAQYVTASALFYSSEGYYMGEVAALQSQRISAAGDATFDLDQGVNVYASDTPISLLGDKSTIVYVAGYVLNARFSCVQ